LTYCIPRKDTKPMAKELIKKFGSFSGVFDVSLKELEDTPGVGLSSAVLIKLVKEIFCAYLAERMRKKDLLSSPQLAVDFARVKLAGLSHEAFMVIYLTTKNEVIECEIIHEGTVDRAIIYPRRVVESALIHHASGVLLVHNHPSGHPDPSDEDKKITRTISQAAQTVDIKVIDHIIVGKGGYCSFVEKNLI
ncbi:DNA repair protein RadC, partial [Candidatus Aerophobetes bacterium]|nr:DNA repair protein RadC [Candidatus Aerophobetes bacterium]